MASVLVPLKVKLPLTAGLQANHDGSLRTWEASARLVPPCRVRSTRHGPGRLGGWRANRRGVPRYFGAGTSILNGTGFGGRSRFRGRGRKHIEEQFIRSGEAMGVTACLSEGRHAGASASKHVHAVAKGLAEVPDQVVVVGDPERRQIKDMPGNSQRDRAVPFVGG